MKTHPRFFPIVYTSLRENVALRICVIYAITSTLWILFSDLLMFSFFGENGSAALISMLKGVTFVLVTSVLIYTLIDRSVGAVKQSEERYRGLIETSPDAIAILDLDAHITMVNHRTLLLSGYTHIEELIGKSLLDFAAPLDRERVYSDVQSLLQAGMLRNLEYTAIQKDGSSLPVELSASLVVDRSKVPKAIMVIIRDIRERRQAESELRLLAQTVASTKDCVSITDLEDKILFVNDAFLATYQYSRDELVGKPVSMLRSPSTPSAVHQQIRPATLNGGWYGEILNRKKDGTDFPVELWTSVVKNETGDPVAMVGVARDITDRKLVEEALRTSETKFRSLIEQAADGVFTADSNGSLLLVNPKACEMLGYTEAELLRANIRDTYSSDELELAVTRMQEAKAGKPSQFERRMKRKDGSLFPVEVSLQRLRDGTFQGIVRDISARQQAEESIRKLYVAIEQSDEVIFMTEPDGMITYVNPAFEKVYGFKEHEVIGKTPRVIKSGLLTENDYGVFWKHLLSGEK